MSMNVSFSMELKEKPLIASVRTTLISGTQEIHTVQFMAKVIKYTSTPVLVKAWCQSRFTFVVVVGNLLTH